MKKIQPKKRTVLPVLTVLLFLSCAILSCASGSGGGYWNPYPGTPAPWDYRTGEITVTVDHVPEEGIASQIRVIAETLLTGRGKNTIQAATHLLIDIRVEQRSFLHNVELLNTIYIDCLIRDGEGHVFGREYEYRTGKGSIISAREQERLCRIVLKRILASRRNRYRKSTEAGKNDE
ncbi:MAG: hypothetical protein LBD96_04830 [Treponema sp.]|jgi:hypothetical protein|nr:hypothetical protein [Treponema sp.]